VVLGHSLGGAVGLALAGGGNDPMNTDEQLARLDVPTVTLPGLGHNAHVESPGLSVTLLDRWATPAMPG